MNLFEDQFHSITKDCVSFPIPEGVHTPWFKNTGEIPVTLKYYNGSMVDTLEDTAKARPDLYAYNFFEPLIH